MAAPPSDGAVQTFDITHLDPDTPARPANRLQFWTLDPAPDAYAGAVVLLVHGLGCAGRDPASAGFDQQQVRQLCRHGRVVAPDLLGHGGSGCPRGEEPYHMAQQARVLAALLAHLRATHVYLVGHSMGGPIALAVAEACHANGASEGASVRCVLYSEPNVDGGDCFGSRQGLRPSMDLSLDSAVWRECPSKAANAASCRDLVRLSDSGELLGRMLALHLDGVPALVLVGEQNKGRLTSESALLEAGFPLKYVARAGHCQHIDNPEGFYTAAREFMAVHQAQAEAARR